MKKILTVIVVWLVVIPVYAIDNATTLHEFQSGETISSSKMNENFSYLDKKIDNLSSDTASSSSSVPKYIITGSNGLFMQSNDGLSWTDRKNSGSGISFSSFSHEIGSNVFSGNSGDIWYTDDFISFDVVEKFYINRQNVNNNGNNFYFFGVNNNYYFVLQEWGEVYSSNDLINWSFKFQGIEDQSYHSINYLNGNLLSRNGSSGNIFYAKVSQGLNAWVDSGYSDNAANYFSYKDGNYFYASSSSNSGQKCQIYSSDDMETWNRKHTSINGDYNNGFSSPAGIEIVNEMIKLNCGYSIATSIDNGNTWTDFFEIKSNDSASLVFFNGNYYTYGVPSGGFSAGAEINSDNLYKSSDGNYWENILSGLTINYIFSDNKIYLLGNNGQIIYSEDGTNWQVMRISGQSLNYMVKLN